MLPVVVVSEAANKRLKRKHPWIFSNEIQTKPDVPPGERVEVHDSSGRFVSIGYYNPHTLIAVRTLSFKPRFDPVERLNKAIALRERWYDIPVYRVIYGESDGLPGLIVDRYGDTLVAQVLTAGMEKMWNEVCPVLLDCLKPARILLRNDSSYRELEGLDRKVEWVFGEPVEEETLSFDSLQFIVQYQAGQKTGFFLDQRDNRRRLAAYGPGEKMLDVFSYTGAWALYGARAGIKTITAVDSSEDALAVARRNAELNGYSIATVCSDAVEYLRTTYGSAERYDRIVLDPPAFCKSKRQLHSALRGYREINLRGMKLLKPGGFLFTCSCSQPVTPDFFIDMLRAAASDSGRIFHLRELLLQPPDHPILLNFPESAYLKCAILQVF